MVIFCGCRSTRGAMFQLLGAGIATMICHSRSALSQRGRLGCFDTAILRIVICMWLVTCTRMMWWLRPWLSCLVERYLSLFFQFKNSFFFLSRVFLSNQTCHFCCIHSNSYVEYDCFFWHFKPTKDVICIAHLFVLKFKLQHDGEYDCFSYKNSPFLVFLSYKHAFCVAYLFFFLHVWVQTPTCSRIWLFFQLQKNHFSFGFLANQTMNFAPFLFCFVLFFYVYENNNVLKTPSWWRIRLFF